MGGGGQPLQQLPGGMTREELEKRQELEYDLVMAQNVQKALLMSSNLADNYSNNKVFEKMPDREKIGKEAMLLHSDFARMQVVLLESIRKKVKECSLFSGRKDLKLTDIRQEADVLMEGGKVADEPE
jgi:hypothetical protein